MVRAARARRRGPLRPGKLLALSVAYARLDLDNCDVCANILASEMFGCTNPDHVMHRLPVEL